MHYVILFHFVLTLILLPFGTGKTARSLWEPCPFDHTRAPKIVRPMPAFSFYPRIRDSWKGRGYDAIFNFSLH